MSSAKWTPGPWMVTGSGYTKYIDASIGGGTLQEVAGIGPTEAHEQQEANAALIASAPALYALLEDILKNYECGEIVDAEIATALTKARGES